MSRSRTWNIGTAVVVVLVLVAGWFLAVAPQRSAAAESRETQEATEAQNSITESKIRQLKIEQKAIPAQRSKIEKIRQRLPAQPLQPALLRQLALIADETNVKLGNVSPSAIAPVSGATGVAMIPLEIGAVGSYTELRRFLAALESNKRSIIVTGFKIGAAPAASEGEAKNDDGDLSIAVSGRVFISQATSAAPATQPSAGGATAPQESPASPSSDAQPN